MRPGTAVARAIVIAAAAAAAAVPWPAHAVDWWVAAYHRFQPFVTATSNRVSFALLDVLLACAVAGTLGYWAKRLRAARRGARIRAVAGGLAATLAAASAFVLWFFAAWGFHYRQPPAERRFDIDRDRVDAAAVRQLAVRATDMVNRLVLDAHEQAAPALPELAQRLRPALERTLPALGVRAQVEAGTPKRTLLAPFFRWASVAGLTDPFFLEVMVTPEALPFERPAILAHEWSHLAGFARESDASFAGFLVCQRGDAEARYSAWFDLLARVRAQVPRDTRAEIDARLAPEVRADIRAVVARMRRAVPAVRDAAWRGYDAYLKTQRVERGVEDYDQVVVLLAGARYDGEWVPRPRGRPPGPR